MTMLMKELLISALVYRAGAIEHLNDKLAQIDSYPDGMKDAARLETLQAISDRMRQLANIEVAIAALERGGVLTEQDRIEITTMADTRVALMRSRVQKGGK
jgi:hypothetical protein